MNMPLHFRRQVAQHTDLRSDYHTFLYRDSLLRSFPLGGVAKRIVDLAIASFALILFLPLFGLVAVTIAFFEGTPVLYRHSRVGYGRRPFLCLKFRTMVANGDEILKHHLQSSPAAARDWAESRKLKNDPRVTVVGGVLRKFSLDELPQLINVLRGEMSIVGPRPIVADEAIMYGPDAHYYFMARPGLTGPWQVGGRSDERYEDRIALDRAYVENWSLWKDVSIMLKTVPAILSRKGSY
jgi:exopolysaccharide production protein ExoY